MQDLKKFEQPGIVSIEAGKGGLTRLLITTESSTAEIYTHGAHVTRFELKDQPPILWMSQWGLFEPEKPIRGGVPICLPWFGPNKDNPKLPAHGFARVREWTVDSVECVGSGRVIVTLSFETDKKTHELWPADLKARHIITIDQALEMKLQVQNASRGTLRIEEALHTYLTVGDIKQTTVQGLGGRKYIDKVDGAKIKEQTDPIIHFTAETDRVYLDTQSVCMVHDPVLNRRIEVAKTGSNATVVWNPWIAKAKAMPDFGDNEWPGMLCVETANVAQHAIEIQPRLIPYHVSHDPHMAQQVAILTGAGGGIGRATAIELSRIGYSTVLVGRTEESLKQTRASIKDALVVTGDVTKLADVDSVVKQTLTTFSRIDAIINNAGLAPVLGIEQTTPQIWHEVVETNLSSAFYLCRAVWPTFKKQHSGVIVNISSMAARDPFPGFVAYGAAKAGLVNLGLSLAKEGATIGVRVHTVAPGAVETPMLRKILSPEQLPSEDILSPADVARVVVECLSGRTSQKSGDVIWLSK